MPTNSDAAGISVCCCYALPLLCCVCMCNPSTNRAIAQANITREYLHSLVQNDFKMPSGPVIISPHGLLPSLYRSVLVCTHPLNTQYRAALSTLLQPDA